MATAYILCFSFYVSVVSQPPDLSSPSISSSACHLFHVLVRLLCLSPCVVGKGRTDLHLLGWEWCTRCPLCLLARHTKILLNWTAEREMPTPLPTVNHKVRWWNILRDIVNKKRMPYNVKKESTKMSFWWSVKPHSQSKTPVDEVLSSIWDELVLQYQSL